MAINRARVLLTRYFFQRALRRHFERFLPRIFSPSADSLAVWIRLFHWTNSRALARAYRDAYLSLLPDRRFNFVPAGRIRSDSRRTNFHSDRRWKNDRDEWCSRSMRNTTLRTNRSERMRRNWRQVREKVCGFTAGGRCARSDQYLACRFISRLTSCIHCHPDVDRFRDSESIKRRKSRARMNTTWNRIFSSFAGVIARAEWFWRLLAKTNIWKKKKI